MEEMAYLCFRRGELHYAITNHKIIRVLKETDLQPLPFADDVYQGVLLVENSLAAIVDIEAGHKKEAGEGYFIFLEFKGDVIGVCADELEGIERISDQEWVEGDLPYASLCCEIRHKRIYLLQP